jgi:hypothetical protein
VKDSNGQKLACVHFEDEPGWRSAAKLVTHEARRIAANVALMQWRRKYYGDSIRRS